MMASLLISDVESIHRFFKSKSKELIFHDLINDAVVALINISSSRTGHLLSRNTITLSIANHSKEYLISKAPIHPAG